MSEMLFQLVPEVRKISGYLQRRQLLIMNNTWLVRGLIRKILLNIILTYSNLGELIWFKH